MKGWIEINTVYIGVLTEKPENLKSTQIKRPKTRFKNKTKTKAHGFSSITSCSLNRQIQTEFWSVKKITSPLGFLTSPLFPDPQKV